jgi:hypothetical protein
MYDKYVGNGILGILIVSIFLSFVTPLQMALFLFFLIEFVTYLCLLLHFHRWRLLDQQDTYTDKYGLQIRHFDKTVDFDNQLEEKIKRIIISFVLMYRDGLKSKIYCSITCLCYIF